MAEPLKIDESDTNLSAKDNKETNVASTSKEADEEDKKLVSFQCSHCFLFEKCRFGDLSFDKSGYTESVFYLRDPFVPPDFHKKDYAVQDFVVLGSLCYLCGQPVCIDEECSLFYVHTYCISCVSRERDRFPGKLIQGISSKLK
uniref:Cysteine-rich DPF motif domain-containing protein 1 n=1 Tax=Acrobeloides nanus TaxID=290746 RepID=A0A914CT46_9BILA